MKKSLEERVWYEFFFYFLNSLFAQSVKYSAKYYILERIKVNILATICVEANNIDPTHKEIQCIAIHCYCP
jgi:hypothetical protein